MMEQEVLFSILYQSIVVEKNSEEFTIQARKGYLMYKSQLQEFAQKTGIPPPVYEFVKEGASHEPRFKATVTLNNVTYESLPGFPNLKSAEQDAAKTALETLLQMPGGTGVAPSPVHESGLCKNLLQEYSQKNSLPNPVYQSHRSGEAHASVFRTSVEIAGVKYIGGPAKSKKEAEIKAATTALRAIQSVQTRDFSPDVLDRSPRSQSEDQLGSDSMNVVSSYDPASFDWKNIPQYKDFTSYETL